MATKHFAGLDLGQVHESTALAILERAADPARPYAVRHLQRWPVGTSYPEIVEDVGRLVRALAPAPVLGGPDMYPVEGRVVFGDGKAARELSGGAVEFRSLDVTPAVSARGLIRDDGTFSLTTHKPGDGAVAGRHRVLISPPIILGTRADVPTANPAARPVKLLVDPRVTAFETSELEVVVDKRATAVTLTVERPPR